MARARKTQRDPTAERIEQALGGQARLQAGQWAHFSPHQHVDWCERTLYRKTKGPWLPLKYSAWQRDGIARLLAVCEDGTLRYSTVMPCFPRRCDKTGIITRYELHRAIAYPDQSIAIQGNSSDQGAEAVLGQIVSTIQNSPKFRRVGRGRDPEVYEIDATDAGGVCDGPVRLSLYAGAITLDNGSSITVWPAAGGSTLGRGLSVYHNTEGCLARSDANYQVGASSVGDQWCGLAAIDSNMGDADNFVARFADLAEKAEAEAELAGREGREPDPSVGDPQIGCVLIQFADLGDILRRGCGVGLDDGEPIHPWLDAAWIRSRFATMTRGEFLRNHANQPSGIGEAIWSDEQVAPLFVETLPARVKRDMLPTLHARLPLPEIADAQPHADARLSWTIGVGLDRAGAFSKDPDRSVLSAVGKTVVPWLVGRALPVYDEHGEAIGEEVSDGEAYVLLGAWEYRYALRDPIQTQLTRIDQALRIDAMALEAYQASDLAEWSGRQRFGRSTQIRHMTAQAKQQLVTFAHGLIVTRRFFASAAYPVLRAEIANYREDASGGGLPSYGGKRKTAEIDLPVGAMLGIEGGKTVRQKTWIKDDYWESVMWAIEAARSAEPPQRAAVHRKPAGL